MPQEKKLQTTKFKTVILHLALTLILGLVVLYPTFGLALTGDDYLGYWRLTKELGVNPEIPDLIRYFFTDYGPQDLVTYTIHTFVGFNAMYYFIIAFILRYIASISFYPLVTKLTNSRAAAFITTAFFMISSTGMEVLDWSFNMPSHLGIALMNIGFYYLFSANGKKFTKQISAAIILFNLAIVSQPIRMLIIVPVVITVFFYLIVSSNKLRLRLLLASVIFIAAFLFVYSNSNYGAVGEVVKSTENKNELLGMVANIYSKMQNQIQNSNGQILLTPIGQIGNIVFPTTEILTKVNLYPVKAIKNIVFMILLSNLLAITIFSKSLKLTPTKSFIYSAIYLTLFTIIYKSLVPLTGLNFHHAILLSYFIGESFLVFALMLFNSTSNKTLKTGLATAILVILFSFLPTWLRTPSGIDLTQSRYLIVSSAGLAIFCGIFYKILSSHKFTVLLLIILFLVNISATKKYVWHLHASRNSTLADSLRNSIGYDPRVGNVNEPFLYYFEVDNPDIFYHSLYFGFPFFMNYYKGEMQNPWLIIYTSSWEETLEAYKTGKSIQRFIAGVDHPPNISNFFAYKLENGNLRDITTNTRVRLIESTDEKMLNPVR